jgi:DNA-binding MarR family transcriptional regulator
MLDPSTQNTLPVEDTASSMPLTVSRRELLRKGSDSDFRQLVHSLLAFSAKLQGIRNAFGSYLGLTGVQYTILIAIAHMQGDKGVGIKQVADHLSFSGAFVTNETKKLEKSGLVNKSVNLSDRRRVRLTVTDACNELLVELAPVQRKTNDSLFKNLSASDFERLLALSRGLLDGAEEASSLIQHLSAIAPREGKP